MLFVLINSEQACLLLGTRGADAKKGEGFILQRRWADGEDELGHRVRRRVGDPTSLSWVRKEERTTAETTLDGLYVIRTSLGAEQLKANAAVAGSPSRRAKVA